MPDMRLLIEYLLVNMAVAYFLEKSKLKMRVATVTHAVSFTVILVLLLAVQRESFIATSMDFILGSEMCGLLREALSAEVAGLVAPIMMIELVSAIFFFVAGIILTVRVVEYVRLCKYSHDEAKDSRKKIVFTYKVNPLVFVNKLSLKNCVMRC